MIKQKEGRKASGNIFDNTREYYKCSWQNYYPTVIRLVPPKSYILDIGCGRAGLLQYLRDKKNCNVTGLDLSDDVIKICKDYNIKVIKCDLEEDEIPGTYDVIILSAVIEHLISPVSVLKKIRRNLNENGCIIIGFPNFSHLKARILYLLGKNVKRFGNDKKGAKLGVQSPGHINFFNKATMEYILEKTGYTPIEWSYYKPPSIPKNLKLKFYKKIILLFVNGFYKIDHELFSSFIAVKAVKKNEKIIFK